MSACQSKYDKQEEFIRGYAIVSKDGKYGIINEDGEEVVALNFESISYFIGDYAKVKIGDKFGFVDKTGKIVIEPKYDKIYGYNGDYAKVVLDGKYGLINKEAKEIIAPKYDAVNYNIIGRYFEVASNGEVSKLSYDEVVAKS
jgi:hypothetical protein